MEDVSLDDEPDPLFAVRSPPPPLPATVKRTPPPPAPKVESPDTMLRKALGGGTRLMGDTSDEEDELAVRRAPAAGAAPSVAPGIVPREEAKAAAAAEDAEISCGGDWLDLLGVAGADLVDVVPCGVSEEALGRLVSARRESALGVWAPAPRAREAVCGIAAAYDADGFEDALAVAALALCLAAPPGSGARAALLEGGGSAAERSEKEALGMLRAATRRLKTFRDENGEALFDRCVSEFLPRVDPELGAAVLDRPLLRAAFLESFFAGCCSERDAAAVWRALLEEERPAGMCAAALCVLVVRCRGPLLAARDDDESPAALFDRVVDASFSADGPSLVHLAAWVLDPLSAAMETGVDVVSFGPGPLGILLTKKPRGLVISNFSSAERTAAPKPKIGDALVGAGKG